MPILAFGIKGLKVRRVFGGRGLGEGWLALERGEATRARAAAFCASLISGPFGALVLTGFVLIARPILPLFSVAELFMLTLLGLSMVACSRAQTGSSESPPAASASPTE